MKTLLKIYFLVLWFIPALVFAEEGDASTPILEIKNTISQAVDVVRTYPGEENQTKRREELRKVINPRFDFNEMAKRSLGAHWKDCNEEERMEYISLFADLLAKTYLSKIEFIKEDTVTVEGEQIKFPKAMVKTIVHYDGDEFPLDYRLLNREGNWKVYDVIIENIGLVVNYRNEFSGIIRKEKFAGLLQRLREKSSKKD